ncbi:MAG: ATP-binding protein [Vicinamibacterales bacterium]
MTRLSRRFAMLFAAAAIVPLLVYGGVSLLTLQTGTRTTVIEGNSNVARRAAEHIELYFDSTVRIIRAVAADLGDADLDLRRKDRALKEFVVQFPEFSELTLLDGAGAPIASSRIGKPLAKLPGADSRTIKGVFVSPFVLDADLLPTLVLAVPIQGANEERGWLVGRASLEDLWRIIGRIRLGSEGFASLVSSEGQLVAHGDLRETPRIARGDNVQAHPLVSQLRGSGGASSPIVVGEYDGRYGPTLGVATTVPGLDWLVLVEQPESEAFAVAERLQVQLGVAIAISLLVMVVVGYFHGHRFIQPILALTRGSSRVAEGHLDTRVAVTSHDELGQLGDAFNNMTARLQGLQDEVRAKERQATFGRVAIGLVHDLSHPIQNIGNSAKLMTRLYDDTEYRGVFEKTVDRELAEVRRLLDDLRNIAKPVPVERFPLDLNAVLADLTEAMQSTVAKAGLELRSDLVFGPLYVEGDVFALNRVCRNLIINACQATMPGGQVVLRTIRAQGHAIIEVADNGCGIPAERLATIFEDFVTTKRRGLGLGLAIARKIVEQLDGTISVASEPGRGTTFTLRFPLTEARPSRVTAV